MEDLQETCLSTGLLLLTSSASYYFSSAVSSDHFFRARLVAQSAVLAGKVRNLNKKQALMLEKGLLKIM